MPTFDDRSVKRIVRTVITVEGDSGKPPRTGQQNFSSPFGFWVEITNRVNDKYSWTAFEPRSDHSMTKNDQWRKGDANATDGFAVAMYGSDSVPKESKVWLEPSRNEQYFVFFYSGTKHGILKTDITKRIGVTPGQGTVEFKNYDGTAFSVGEEFTVYNFWTSQVDFVDATTDTGVQMSHDAGYWWLVGEDCGSDGTA